MYKIKVNDKFNFEIAAKKNQTFVNDILIDLNIHKLNTRTFHILYKNRSFHAEIIEINKEEKTCSIKVNSNIYSMLITDQFDELLHQLGMDTASTLKVSDIKAPMPGMVLKILAAEGEHVKKGGNLLVLEAMKMENIIKAPADVEIKTIKVKAGDKVEKNQVMLIFS